MCTLPYSANLGSIVAYMPRYMYSTVSSIPGGYTLLITLCTARYSSIVGITSMAIHVKCGNMVLASYSYTFTMYIVFLQN